MMYLNEINLVSAFSRQYLYKLKGYSTLSLGLIIAQIFSSLSSYGGTSNMSSSGDGLSVSVSNYSGNSTIMFTFLWILFIALTLTTKPYRNMGFTLVANRLSDNLANIGLLLTACVFGGITASLSGVLLRVIMYFTFSHSEIVNQGFRIVYADLLLSMTACILYFILVAAMGYLFGIFAQLHLVFAVLIPVCIFGLARTYTDLAHLVFEFFVGENVPLLFALKIVMTALVLFSLSVLLANRMEVRA